MALYVTLGFEKSDFYTIPVFFQPFLFYLPQSPIQNTLMAILYFTFLGN